MFSFQIIEQKLTGCVFLGIRLQFSQNIVVESVEIYFNFIASLILHHNTSRLEKNKNQKVFKWRKSQRQKLWHAINCKTNLQFRQVSHEDFDDASQRRHRHLVDRFRELLLLFQCHISRTEFSKKKKQRKNLLIFWEFWLNLMTKKKKLQINSI